MFGLVSWYKLFTIGFCWRDEETARESKCAIGALLNKLYFTDLS
jgi:hypothetical protein